MAGRKKTDDLAAVDALERAQEIAWDAMEAPTRKRRATLANKALELSPHCADAYVVLAEDAESPEAAAVLFRRGVEAGAAALGPERFEQDAGAFWGLLETRPYMRALHGLAISLWSAGKKTEAVDQAREMLRLNPNDNQGVRYGLLAWLLEMGRVDETQALLDVYDDEASAVFAWSRVLLAFRRHGADATADAALTEAIEENPHVPELLLGLRPTPEPPPYYSPGEESEAVVYVIDAQDAWNAAPGALSWLSSAISARESADPGNSENALIDRAVLGLLLLGRHDGERVWKSFDWQAMNRLHAAGLITDPVGRGKSVVLTPKGLKEAEAAYAALFTS